ncbi:MAG: glycosyltransferase family 2 protein [Muribaculaceae bacterium]|nr:glycosyltransferase family 2 protein [Muribaculaceae bacterium]
MFMKDIKAVTMVRNDIFLRKWVEYYGRELGKENLYIFFDGTDQEIPDFCEGTHAKLCPKMQGAVVNTEKERSRFLSAEAGKLLSAGADMVIGTDADEFLIVDPDLGKGLREFLSEQPAHACISGFGLDVMQHLPTEGPVDFGKPFLSQRHRGWLYSRYTKPSVITRPVTWGSGFHRVKGHNFHVADGLYLFHFGCVDLERLRKISADPARVAGGWTRHQRKRERAIAAVSALEARPWDPTVKWVRRMQRVCRSIFAPNKPTTYGIKFVVRIPDRFSNCI